MYEGIEEYPNSLHRYLYTSGNPVNRIDSTGMGGTVLLTTIDSTDMGGTVLSTTDGATKLQGTVELTTVVQFIRSGSEAGQQAQKDNPWFFPI